MSHIIQIFKKYRNKKLTLIGKEINTILWMLFRSVYVMLFRSVYVMLFRSVYVMHILNCV